MKPEEKLKKIIEEAEKYKPDPSTKEKIDFSLEQLKRSNELFINLLLSKEKKVDYDENEFKSKIERIIQENDKRLTNYLELKRNNNVKIEIVDRRELLRGVLKEFEKNLELMIYFQYSPEAVNEKQKRLSKIYKTSIFSALKNMAKIIGAGMVTLAMYKYFAYNTLGKYDTLESNLNIKNEGVISIIAPNVIEKAEKIGINLEDFMTRVAIHEEIHHRQLTNYPQIVEKRNELSKNLLALGYVIIYDGFGGLNKEEAKYLYQKVSNEITSLMTCLEGHASFFEKKILKEVIKDYDGLIKKIEKYRKKRRTKRIKPLKVKMDQYIEGEKFVKAVYGEFGTKSSRLIFENLPTIEEIKNPNKYIEKLKPLI